VAPAILLGLLEGTREAVNLGVFDADSMVLIYREQGPQSVTISSRLGSRRPMHASGLGKAYMAALRGSERHALIERLDLKRYTPETIVDKAALERGLVEIQKRGFADDVREFEQTWPAARPPCSITAPFRWRQSVCRVQRTEFWRNSTASAPKFRPPHATFPSGLDSYTKTRPLDVSDLNVISSFRGTCIPFNET